MEWFLFLNVLTTHIDLLTSTRAAAPPVPCRNAFAFAAPNIRSSLITNPCSLECASQQLTLCWKTNTFWAEQSVSFSKLMAYQQYLIFVLYASLGTANGSMSPQLHNIYKISVAPQAPKKPFPYYLSPMFPGS